VVSIGLCIGGIPVLGVVYDPYADELFAAANGQGAFLNGRRINADSGVSSLQKALVLIDVGYERSPAGTGVYNGRGGGGEGGGGGGGGEGGRAFPLAASDKDGGIS